MLNIAQRALSVLQCSDLQGSAEGLKLRLMFRKQSGLIMCQNHVCTQLMHIVLLEQPQQSSICDLTKILLTPKLSYLLSATLPIKLKLRLQIGGRLLIANRLDQPLRLANQKPGAVVRSLLLFGRCTIFLCHLPASENGAKLLHQTHFAQPNQHVLTLLSSNLNVPITS